MVTLKKLIFLSNKQDKSNDVATLSIEKKSNGIFCKLKYYGTLSGDYILGIKSAENIHKQNVKLGSEEYSFLLPVDIELNNAFGCVLCKNDHGEFTPILWGNEKSQNYKNQILNSLKNNFSKLIESSITTGTNLKTNNTQKNVVSDTTYPETLKQEINLSKDTFTPGNLNNKQNTEAHSVHDSCTQHYNIFNNTESEKNDYSYTEITLQEYIKETNKLSSNGYAISPFRELESQRKKHNEETISQLSIDDTFYENTSDTAYALNSQLFETNDDEINQIINKELGANSKHDFYNMIADQLQELFDKYPEELNLSKLIDDSKWCKINRDYDNMCYVVGIIYDNNDIKYICYGVPGKYDTQPPREMQDYSQWLPTDIADPYNNGYWVMYQDADTGENIFLN